MPRTSRAMPLLFAPLLLIAPVLAAAQESSGPPTLYASGSAPYRLRAEGVEFIAVIESNAKTATLAAAPCVSMIDSAQASLTRLGIRGLTVEVMEAAVAPIASRYGEAQTADRYSAKSLLRVRLTDLGQLRRVSVALLEAGTTRFTGFRYSAAGAAEARRVAYEAAAVAARAQAEQIARALGGRLGELREAGSGDADPSAMYQHYAPDQDQSAGSYPEIRGTISVNLTWTFVPGGR
jgi:uncharacterized protein YggE